mgnify:CR=1 FL=1
MVLFFQAEDGIRDLVRSRGLGDVYKRQDSLSIGTRRGELLCSDMRRYGDTVLLFWDASP